ncbi:DUF362 domain-containing protein [bacterium]|nr:DUF362 domain-containing protein [bacterium]
MKMDETRVGIAGFNRYHRPNTLGYEDPALVSTLIRNALIEGGLGLKNPNSPLVDIIEPGMTVLLKPNWVLHYNKSNKGMDCMVTHPNFIEAVLKEVIKAKPKRIIIGDAPIQSAVFESLLPKEWIDHLKAIAHPYQIEIIDFRKEICYSSRWTIRVSKDIRDPNCFILFDIGSASLLEPISLPTERFRNTSYDHKQLTKTHYPGCHQYLLCREIFESDVIINLPKLKAHRKAGLTAALKNIVGINGNKDFLPHHRIGGSVQGGDCYEGNMPLKRLSEYFADKANCKINSSEYFIWRIIALLFLRANKIIFGDDELEGSWYGNDTSWRMVLDLNRIVIYGRSDGSLSLTPLRKIYSLTDGIIAGEGMGPLSPEPIKLGVVTFASSSPFADLVHTALMHFDWRKISLVRNAFQDFPYRLTTHLPDNVQVYAEGRVLSLEEVANIYGQTFKPPIGWKDHIELNQL